MSDAASVRRPRRWWRAVCAVFLILGVLSATVFVFAPSIAARLIAPHLPWTATFPHGSVTVQQVTTAPPDADPEVQMVGSPAVLRLIAAQASGRWLPPGLVRGGQSVVGEINLPILRPAAFRWQALVAGSAPAPLASLRVSHVDLTNFLRESGQSVVSVGGTPIMRCIYIVDWGRIEDDDEPGQPPLVRRQKVVARGSILLIAGQAQRVLKVARLAGHAWTTLVPVPEGYRVQMRVRIEEADAEPITLPVIGDARPLLLKQLENAANDGLEHGLEKVVLPPWFPTDLRTEVKVE